MSMFIGIVAILVIFGLVGTFVRFVLRTARHAVRDASDYAAGRPVGTTQSRAQHRSVRQPRPTFTREELDYFAAHVPASAGRQLPQPRAGRPDLRNTRNVDEGMLK